MKWQLNTYLYLFHGYTPWVFSFIIFFIHDSIVSYPNAEVDKKFFKSWDLHIPHWLRDILWKVRTWSSEMSFFLFLESTKSNHFLLAHIPHMNESHDHGRPFSTSSSTASRCYALWIFTFFNYFLKSIFWFKFLSSNSLIKESNIFGVFREDTCGISWSVIESTMIFLALIKFFLCKALRLMSL